MAHRKAHTVYLFFCACALGISLLFTSSLARAAVQLNFESPAANDTVAGVALIRGFIYDDANPTATVTNMQFFIDGQQFGTIACCTDRPDVKQAHPEAPLNTGFGATFNWGRLLSEGAHTIRVAGQISGVSFDSGERTVTVVKPGGFEFLNSFVLDFDETFTEVLEDGHLNVEGITIQDKATGTTKIIDAEFEWNQACQCLVMIHAQNEEE